MTEPSRPADIIVGAPPGGGAEPRGGRTPALLDRVAAHCSEIDAIIEKDTKESPASQLMREYTELVDDMRQIVKKNEAEPVRQPEGTPEASATPGNSVNVSLFCTPEQAPVELRYAADVDEAELINTPDLPRRLLSGVNQLNARMERLNTTKLGDGKVELLSNNLADGLPAQALSPVVEALAMMGAAPAERPLFGQGPELGSAASTRSGYQKWELQPSAGGVAPKNSLQIELSGQDSLAVEPGSGGQTHAGDTTSACATDRSSQYRGSFDNFPHENIEELLEQDEQFHKGILSPKFRPKAKAGRRRLNVHERLFALSKIKSKSQIALLKSKAGRGRKRTAKKRSGDEVAKTLYRDHYKRERKMRDRRNREHRERLELAGTRKVNLVSTTMLRKKKFQALSSLYADLVERYGSMANEGLCHALVSLDIVRETVGSQEEQRFEKDLIDIVWQSMSVGEESVPFERFERHLSFILDPHAQDEVQKVRADAKLRETLKISGDFLDIAPELIRRFNLGRLSHAQDARHISSAARELIERRRAEETYRPSIQGPPSTMMVKHRTSATTRYSQLYGLAARRRQERDQASARERQLRSKSEMEQCTFQPRINNNTSPTFGRSGSIYDRLHNTLTGSAKTRHEMRLGIKQPERKTREEAEIEQHCTFRPTLVSAPRDEVKERQHLEKAQGWVDDREHGGPQRIEGFDRHVRKYREAIQERERVNSKWECELLEYARRYDERMKRENTRRHASSYASLHKSPRGDARDEEETIPSATSESSFDRTVRANEEASKPMYEDFPESAENERAERRGSTRQLDSLADEVSELQQTLVEANGKPAGAPSLVRRRSIEVPDEPEESYEPAESEGAPALTRRRSIEAPEEPAPALTRRRSIEVPESAEASVELVDSVQTPSRRLILNVDVNINQHQQETIHLYEGDCVEEVARVFAEQHALPDRKRAKLEKLLKHSLAAIEQSGPRPPGSTWCHKQDARAAAQTRRAD